MKNIHIMKVLVLSLFFSMLTISCTKDYPNPNNPTEEVVLTTKEGLFALSIGLMQYYSTTVMEQVIEAPGITTRELGVTNTFLSINELASGGDALSGDSGGVIDPWVTLNRAKGMTESLLGAVEEVSLSDETRSSISAFAQFYKAMILGNLIQQFEQAAINNSFDGKATFSDRTVVLTECISLLENARDELTTNPVSDEFENKVLGTDIDLLNSINAFLSRYNLMAGNYAATIASANAVLNSSGQQTSMFTYDANNVNPIWNRTTNSTSLNPQTNFGLLGSYVPEVGDERNAFYLGAVIDTANLDAGGQQLSEMRGFFTSSISSIPVYLYGELLLNKSEAYARQNMLAEAVEELDLVRTKTNDPYGVNANLADWVAIGGNPNSQADILEEIYKNRSIELFLTGLRFEDSKRFHPNLLTSPNPVNTTNERNRNYYPYPIIERENNPNTPDDPSI